LRGLQNPPVSSSGVQGGRRGPDAAKPKMPPSVPNANRDSQRGSADGQQLRGQPKKIEKDTSVIAWKDFPELSSLWSEHYESVDEIVQRLEANLSDGLSTAKAVEKKKEHPRNKVLVTEKGRLEFRGFNCQPSVALVVRDGRQKEVLAEELVPGDVCLGKKGSCVPADIRLVECSHDLRIDMTAIGQTQTDGTGRGHHRSCEQVGETVGVWEAKNIVFYGCQCIQGTWKGIVVKVGPQTAMGVVAREMGWAEGETADFGKKVGRWESNFEGKTAAIAQKCRLADDTGRCRCTIM